MAAAAPQLQPAIDHLFWTVVGVCVLFAVAVGVLSLLVLALKVVWRGLVLPPWLGRDGAPATSHRRGAEPEAASVAALPYRARAALLTKGELAFYHVLRHVAADRYPILAQVRLADVVQVPRSRPDHLWWFRRVAQKHVAFVLCDPASLRPRLLIGLDDRTHGRAGRRRRDRFVDDVAASASLPLLRVPAQQAYDVQQLADLVARRAIALSPSPAR